MTVILTLLLAQIQVSLSPVPQAVPARLLSPRVAKIAAKWTVALENDSDGPVSVSESAIIRRIPQLNPFDHQSMALLIAEAAKNSGWARAGRISLDLTSFASFVGTAKPGLNWGQPALFGLSAVPVVSSYVITRLKGVDPPVVANFEALAWTAPITLQPGESATASVFTAAPGNPAPVSFTIDTGNLKAAKMVK